MKTNKPQAADIFVFTEQVAARPSDMMFGHFFELGGRAVNGGIYDPESPLARPDGVRADVVAALQELRPTHIRYPGGCGVTYFDWQELVGPVAERPVGKLFRMTGVAQSPAFGIPEAWNLCREIGAELYLTVNAHTQTPEDAANLVEYLNGSTKTKWAELRRAHGRPAPFGVKYFSLGNEIYGGWQAGQKTADEYARWCREAIRQMKRVDPSITVVACGLGRPDPEWDRTVLFRNLGMADMISMHNYFGRPVFADSMAAGRVCQAAFDLLNAAITEAMDSLLGVSTRSFREFLGSNPSPTKTPRPGIAFDEWNVWYRSKHDPEHDLEEWFNYTDALTFASLMHAVLRNADTVRLSNTGLFANCLGTVMTRPDAMVRQSIFYTQKLMRNAHGDSDILRVVVNTPAFSAKHERFFCGIVDPEKAKDETLPSLLHFNDLPGLDVLASRSRDGKRLTLSILQALEKQPVEARLTWVGPAPKAGKLIVHRLVAASLDAVNTYANPQAVHVETETMALSPTLILPPASLQILEFALG